VCVAVLLVSVTINTPSVMAIDCF